MGASTIHFHDNKFDANDTAIEVWLIFVIAEIDKLSERPEWLQEMREDWKLQATAGFGFGVVPNLDKYITDDKRRTLVLELCAKALHELETRGETLRKDYLNSLGVYGEFTKDVPTEFFKSCGISFMKLLEDTLTEDSMNSS